MASKTQIKKVIDKFSKQNFKFLKFIELLLLVKNIPENVSNALKDVDLIYHIDEACNHISWITDYFDRKINPAVRSGYGHLDLRNACRSMPTSPLTVGLLCSESLNHRNTGKGASMTTKGSTLKSTENQ